MELAEIIEIATAAQGGGGIASLLNWRMAKRKEAALVKQDEIEALRKMVDDAYKPTIEHLEGQVAKLYDKQLYLEKRVETLTSERDECKQRLAEVSKKIDGIAAGIPTRNPQTGRFSKR